MRTVHHTLHAYTAALKSNIYENSARASSSQRWQLAMENENNPM